jgi:hypothetical protein
LLRRSILSRPTCAARRVPRAALAPLPGPSLPNQPSVSCEI